ncbi:restriction endonuclease [Streptomyces sp. NPDC047043]|uniref:restriction endonuclease n=1 Tax=Streptomyces sp. NPDC047043 TaxID=3154497 RepID=UPI0033E67FC6
MVTRRPPARRRRPTRRQRPSDAALCAILAAAAATIALATKAAVWLAAHGWVLLPGVALAAAAGAGWVYRRRRQVQRQALQAQELRYALPRLDALHHSEFEHAVQALLRRDGCRNAVRVGGSGDLGADVTATDPYGRRWVIQCKHRHHGDAGAPVGTRDLQILNGTARPVHRADIAVLVTNGRITAPARTFASQQRLHLVDRRLLASWASGPHPLWHHLGTTPPPPRHAPPP